MNLYAQFFYRTMQIKHLEKAHRRQHGKKETRGSPQRDVNTVMLAAAEAEMRALFIDAKEAIHMQQILQEMGYPQPHTLIQTDSSMAERVISSRV